MGMGDAVTGQLQMKALVYCNTSVPMLLVGSGASACSLCWERVFFPCMIDIPKSLKEAKRAYRAALE